MRKELDGLESLSVAPSLKICVTSLKDGRGIDWIFRAGTVVLVK